MPSKRLLFITERFPPDIGGVASSAGRITAAFSQFGWDVDVLTWSRSLQPGDVLPPDGVSQPAVYRVGLYRDWDMTMPHSLNVLEWMHQSRYYNAVWGHYLFPGGFLATWFGLLQGIPSIVSARGNDLDRTMFPPGDFARLLWTLERADAIAAVSADMARKIELLSRRQDGMVLKNAVNSDIFVPGKSARSLRESLGIADHEIVLGFSGELRQKKGQEFLLAALNRVRDRTPACLLIIGEIRGNRDAFLQLFSAQFPESAARIIVTGHLADPLQVCQHLQLCDVYLQPSLWEGMPNALLEAMACGRCCIASDAGGIPEIIEHGKNGFLLPRSQLHQLGEAVLEFLSLDSIVRQEIETAARDRILAEFSLIHETERLQKLMNHL